MATTIRKSKLGVEDVHMDDQGTGATALTEKSDGTFRTVRKLNASHIPTTSKVRTQSATAVNAEQALYELYVSLAAKLALAGGTMSGAIAMGSNKVTGLSAGTDSGDALHAGQVDGSTMECSAGSLRVKNLGIATAKIADLAVTGAKIAAATISADKMVCPPAMYIVGSGTATLTSSATPAAINTGAAALIQSTDIVIAKVSGSFANIATVWLSSTVSGTGSFTCTMSAAPGGTVPIQYIILRDAT